MNHADVQLDNLIAPIGASNIKHASPTWNPGPPRRSVAHRENGPKRVSPPFPSTFSGVFIASSDGVHCTTRLTSNALSRVAPDIDTRQPSHALRASYEPAVRTSCPGTFRGSLRELSTSPLDLDNPWDNVRALIACERL